MIYIISPFRNEEKTIESFVLDIWSYCELNFKSYKIIFINDGSVDGSVDVIKNLKKNCTIIQNKFEHGKGSALKVAYLMAERIFNMQDSDLIIFIDSDGQIKAKEIGTMLRILSFYDADIAVGNKRHPYSSIKYSTTRKLASCTYNKIINLLFGISLRDTQCGLKIFRRYALDRVIEKVNVKRYAFDLELLVALRNSNFRIVDSPVYIGKQLNAGSVNFKNVVQTLFDTIIVWIKQKKGLYADTDNNLFSPDKNG